MGKILVTGAAGFIGFHLTKILLNEGHQVVGVDSLNDYYSTQLKRDRLSQVSSNDNFCFEQFDLSDSSKVQHLFQTHEFDRVVHLAAQAGVRYSIKNPNAYISSNIVATQNILEGCRHQETPHLVYASSSSVYGSNKTQPFSVEHSVDHPVSLYAATKKANELMAHTYSHLYGLPTTGLRFFTVYGPWGRPDMALYLFTKAIYNGEPIDVFNNGNLSRDFTYVDDIVMAVAKVMDHIAAPDPEFDPLKPTPATSSAPYRLFNIGNHQPTELKRFISIIEETIGIKAKKNMLPMQPGDVHSTYADTDALQKHIGFAPSTCIEEGIRKFVEWYRAYHNVA